MQSKWDWSGRCILVAIALWKISVCLFNKVFVDVNFSKEDSKNGNDFFWYFLTR